MSDQLGAPKMFITEQCSCTMSYEFFEFTWIECDKLHACGWDYKTHLDLIRALGAH